METPQPFTLLCTRKQYGPVVLKLPDWPPAAMCSQLPPPELLLDELLDEELELLLDEEELELLELDELDDELLPVPPETLPKLM